MLFITDKPLKIALTIDADLGPMAFTLMSITRYILPYSNINIIILCSTILIPMKCTLRSIIKCTRLEY